MQKTIILITFIILGSLSIIFSFYGLFQTSNLYSTYKFQQGYNQCVIDVNNEIAKQQNNITTKDE